MMKVISGILDPVEAAAFKQDDAGRTMYYPRGVLTRGVIVPPSQVANLRAQVRHLMTIYLFLATPAVIACSVVFGVLPGIIIALLMMIAYTVVQNRLVVGLEPSHERLTVAKSIALAGTGWLIVTTIFSILFFALGIFLIVVVGDAVVGTFSSAVFGALSAINLYALHIKLTARTP